MDKQTVRMPPKNKKLDILEGVHSGLWDMLALSKLPSNDSILPEKVTELFNTVDILLFRLAKYEKLTDHFTDQQFSFRAHSTKENLIFNFDTKIGEFKEAWDETTTELARTFLSNVLGIDAKGMFISVTHHIGSKKNNRLVIGKFPVTQDTVLTANG